MSLATLHHPQLATHAVLADGGFIVRDCRMSVAPDGWDTLSIDVWGVQKTLMTGDRPTLARMLNLWPIGTALADLGLLEWNPEAGLWFLQDQDLQVDGPNCFKGTLVCKGVADIEKPVALQMDNMGSEYTGENISIAGLGGPFARVATVEADPTITAIYPVVGALGTDEVGDEATPPFAMDIPASHWVAVENPLLHWPNGWILERRGIQTLVGVDPEALHYRTDQYIHRYAYTP